MFLSCISEANLCLLQSMNFNLLHVFKIYIVDNQMLFWHCVLFMVVVPFLLIYIVIADEPIDIVNCSLAIVI